jgi:hypothetical protein
MRKVYLKNWLLQFIKKKGSYSVARALPGRFITTSNYKPSIAFEIFLATAVFASAMLIFALT